MGILQSPDPESAVKIMKKRGFLKFVFPHADVTASAKGVGALPADTPLLRLAYLLYGATDDAVQATLSDLKFSGADTKFVRTVLSLRGVELKNTPLFAREIKFCSQCIDNDVKNQNGGLCYIPGWCHWP